MITEEMDIFEVLKKSEEDRIMETCNLTDYFSIIEEYNLTDSPVIKKNVKNILRTEKFIFKKVIEINRSFFPFAVNSLSFEECVVFIRNKDVFNDELLSYKGFPTGKVCLGVFLLCYKKLGSCQILGIISEQQGRVIKNLVDDHHCFFDRDNYKSQVISKGGINYRRIIGIDYNSEINNIQYIKITEKEQIELYKDKRCSVTGKKGKRAKLQPDHKIPVAACKDQGKVPAVLTSDMIRDGSWKKDFQILSQQANQDKQGACSSCMRGEKIWVPPHIEKKQKEGRYISYYEHNCPPCYWYNCEKGNN